MKEHTILVVDDESAIRAFVSAVLEPLGYEVIGAADGLEGLVVIIVVTEAGERDTGSKARRRRHRPSYTAGQLV